jgi:hypothetical protein
MNPSYRIPRPEDTFTLEQLEARIASDENLQATMKAANRIIRDPKLADTEKIARLSTECDFHPDDARAWLKPNASGQTGFNHHNLLRHAANIRRMRRRLQALERERDRPSLTFTFSGGHVEDSAEDGRVRIFHLTKPGPEAIVKLTAQGFILDPSRLCYWQWRGEAARLAVTKVTGMAWPANATVAVQPATRRVVTSTAIRL